MTIASVAASRLAYHRPVVTPSRGPAAAVVFSAVQSPVADAAADTESVAGQDGVVNSEGAAGPGGVVNPDAVDNRGDRVANAPRLNTELAQSWLDWQCRMVAGIIRGVLYLPADDGGIGAAISNWPDGGEGEARLVEAAGQALEKNCGVLLAQQHYGPGDQRTCDLIACPLLVDGEPVAVAAMMISARSEHQQQAVLQLLQWGGVWMETLVRQQSAAQRQSGPFTTNLMSAILGHADAHTAALETVNRLADHLGCERVSIGFRRGLPIRLQALSHVSHFDSRTQLVRRIEAAMEEAVDQDSTLTQPDDPDRGSVVNRAHAELANDSRVAAVCTLPLPGRSATIGAITLERQVSKPFDKDTVEWCESLARLIGPALELKQREERSFWSKGAEALRGLAGGLFGASRLKLKLALVLVVALLTALSVIQGTHKVTAPASIEGAVRQMLVAPQDGYVKQATVRAGDLVKEGQLIAVLDDRHLQLQWQKWQSERNKIEKEYQEALAKRDRTSLSVLRAQVDQVDAELRLLDDQISRTRLHAPFEGIVVSGDLSQSLGAPVETGQVLFEVAPLDSYQVVLEVDEHDVAGLESGQYGQLIIAALPQSSFKLSVDRVVPVAVSGQARNYFRVEASLEQPSTLLRPGMRGVAKVTMEQRTLLWIWTHAVIDRIGLWAWSVGLV